MALDYITVAIIKEVVMQVLVEVLKVGLQLLLILDLLLVEHKCLAIVLV